MGPQLPCFEFGGRRVPQCEEEGCEAFSRLADGVGVDGERDVLALLGIDG